MQRRLAFVAVGRGHNFTKATAKLGRALRHTPSAKHDLEFGCLAGTDVAPSIHLARLRPSQLIGACGLYWRPESAGEAYPMPSSGRVPRAVESYRNFNYIGVRSFVRSGAPL
jgi:hypothetical protein